MLALLVVDVQNDFSEQGALPVPDASKVIPVINKIISQLEMSAIILYSRDWHPADHCSFQKNGGEWPVHCVQGSKGADYIDGLTIAPNSHEILKGQDKDIDSYSAFGGSIVGFEGSVDEFLKQKGVDSIYVMGLATDFCVKETAIDSKGYGYKTIFVQNGSAGVAADTTDQAITAMSQGGITFLKAY